MTEQPTIPPAPYSMEFAGSSTRSLWFPQGTISIGAMVNQNGSLALAQVIVYQDGEYESSQLGYAPRKNKPVLTKFQVAAYP